MHGSSGGIGRYIIIPLIAGSHGLYHRCWHPPRHFNWQNVVVPVLEFGEAMAGIQEQVTNKECVRVCNQKVLVEE